MHSARVRQLSSTLTDQERGFAISNGPVYYVNVERVSSTREQLLEVGLRQLRLTGYTATGLKEVLDLAGVPKGSFYHHFPSKEAFASDLIGRYAEAEAERVHRVLDDTDVPPLKRLRSYFEELSTVNGYQAEVSGCLMGSLSLEVADHNDALQTQLQSLFGILQNAIAIVLRSAIQRGDLEKSNKPDALADFIMNSYEGALVRMKADRCNRPLESFLHFTFDVILKKRK